MLLPCSRADWSNPKLYPDCLDTDSTMWAWEFLRRNFHYEAMFDQATQAKYKNDNERDDKLERLAVAWNMSKLLDPKLSYQQLKKHKSKPLEDFSFSCQQTEIQIPVFEVDDILYENDNKEYPFDVQTIACCEQSTYLAPNELVLKICLDGDIKQQLKNFTDWLNSDQKVQDQRDVVKKLKNRSIRMFNFVDIDGSDWKINPASYSLASNAGKVRVTHLWYSLRVMDAIAATEWKLLKNKPVGNLDEQFLKLRDAVLNQFNKERDVAFAEHHLVLPLIRKERTWQLNKTIRKLLNADFESFRTFGAEYTLGKRYLAVAHADLKDQASGKRSRLRKH